MMDYNNYLRLEVETTPTGLPNLVKNPSGEKGAWFWVTPVSNTLMTAASGQLTFKTNTAQTAYFTTDFMPVAATKYVAGRLDIASFTNVANGISTQFSWYDANKVLLSSSTTSSVVTGTGTKFTPVVQAPASTAYVKMRVNLLRSASTPSAADQVTFSKAMVTWQDTGTVSTTRTNLFTNPSAETNLTKYTAATAGGGTASLTRVSGVSGSTGTWAVRATNTSGTQDAVVVSLAGTVSGGYMAVTGGKPYTFQASTNALTTARNVSFLIQWYNGAFAYVGTAESTRVANTVGSFTTNTATLTAPSSAAYASVAVRVGNVLNNEAHYLDAVLIEQTATAQGYFDGDAADTASIDYAWTGTAHASTSTATTIGSTFDFSEPVTWANILGPTHEISIERKALDAGLLVAEILDPDLDPAISTDIRVGKQVRLRAVVAGVEKSVYEGTLTNALVTYPKDGTRIQISASDNIKTLTQQKESRGMSFILNLPYILEGKGVPWNVNGSGNQATFLNQVSTNENATVLDQVAITRDTHRGYAWVDRNNVLNVWDSNQIPTTVACTYTDVPNAGTDYDSYTDIDVSFNTDAVINIVTVKALRYNGDKSEEITYGPYVDQNSINTWGAFAAEYTINIPNTETESTFAQTFANDVLARNATPVRRASGIGVVVKDERGVKHATEVDLYSLVHVTYSDKVDTDYRVTSIKHSITPDLWTVDYGFAIENSVAAPQVTPSPNGQNYQDATPYVYRYRTVAVSLANNTFTNINFTTNSVTQGIAHSGGVFTVTRAGRYMVVASLGWDNTLATGRRLVRIQQNSTTVAQAVVPGSTIVVTSVATGILNCSVGDTISIEGSQSSGGAYNTDASQATTYVNITWLGG